MLIPPQPRTASNTSVRAPSEDHQRHLPFGAGRHVRFKPVVRLVDDLVNRKGCCWPIRVLAIVLRQLLGDLVQPFVEQALRPCVERRKAADDPRLALRDHQFGARYDEQRRPDQRQAKAVKGSGQGHENSVAL